MIARVKVLESRSLTPTTHAVRFEKPSGFAFKPVQFCGLEIDTDQGSEEYPMSLACSPTRPYLEFGARLSDSPWKRAFAALKPGDTAEVDGAYGHFVLDESRPAVLVAGGIGITPLKGMLEYAIDTRWAQDVTLLYGNRDEMEIPYRDEIDRLAAANPRAKVVYALSRPATKTWTGRVGRIGEALLREALDANPEAKWYVCGKPQMVADAVEALWKMGVPRARTTWEQFSGYE